jgi:hypothetical protein
MPGKFGRPNASSCMSDQKAYALAQTLFRILVAPVSWVSELQAIAFLCVLEDGKMAPHLG